MSGDSENGPVNTDLKDNQAVDELAAKVGSLEEGFVGVQTRMDEFNGQMTELNRMFNRFEEWMSGKSDPVSNQHGAESDGLSSTGMGGMAQTPMVVDDEISPLTDASANGNRALQVAGQQSVGAYSALISNSVGFEMGKAFRQGLHSFNDVVELTTFEELMDDVFARNAWDVNKLLMRGKAGELQDMLGLGFTAHVTAKTIRNAIRDGKTGIVARTISKAIADITENMHNKCAQTDDEDTVQRDPPLEAIRKYSIVICILSTVACVVNMLSVCGGACAEAVALVLLEDICARLKGGRYDAVLAYVQSDTFMSTQLSKLERERNMQTRKIGAPGGVNGVNMGVSAARGNSSSSVGSKRSREGSVSFCWDFWDWGVCPFGDACRYAHVFGNNEEYPGSRPEKKQRLTKRNTSNPLWRKKKPTSNVPPAGAWNKFKDRRN